MDEQIKLNKPWLVAVWPGMGQVAISAGYYLMAKLGMHLVAEFSAQELFEIEHVHVKDGLIRPERLPRSRFLLWPDPAGAHDLLVFIGEAQPPAGKAAFCRRLIEFSQRMGVERIFTFAAMATNMHPTEESRVFGAATDEESLAELKRQELQLLSEGHIGGLNGVILGIAAESQLRGTCLLGETPQIFAQLPFPKASLAVLKTFAIIAGIKIDLAQLSEQAQTVEAKLAELLSRVQREMAEHAEAEEEYGADEEQFLVESDDQRQLSTEDQRRIERLFAEAERDRSKAYELKQELDRLEVFQTYEDRFLDLFKTPE
jgi:proteasome assembly chaperone (PAC2) family protein